jgi:hypothetical protein
LKLQEKLIELQTKNKRNKTPNNNQTRYESKLSISYSKISKLLSEKNAHYTELQMEYLEKVKENNKLKQNINAFEKKLNNLKRKQKIIDNGYQGRNYNELEYQKYSTQEITITSDNKIELNVKIENQLLKEKINSLESEIKKLQNKNNMSDGFSEMGKKVMELLQKLDEYKIKNELLKNKLNKDQNEYLVNQIKEIEKKYNKEKKENKENKKIYEEDIHKKIVLINDLKLEIMDLKKILKNNENINGIPDLKNDTKEISLLKSQNIEFENRKINLSLLNEQELENYDNNNKELNPAEIREKR